MSDPIEQTLCELTGKAHLPIFLNGERVCYWCRRPFETCCEGEAGREAQAPPDTAESVQADREPGTPAHLIGRRILDRTTRPPGN